jgi:hypothetical protein
LEFLTWPYPFFFEAGIVTLFLMIFVFVPSHTDHYKLSYEEQNNTNDTEKIAHNESSSLLNATGGEVDVTASCQETPRATNIKKVNVFQAVLQLGRNPVYVFALLGYIFFDFVIGGKLHKLISINIIAFAFWGPTIVHYTQNISLQTANYCFAGLMLFNGLFGAFAGGFILDRTGGSHGMRGAARASLMCSISLLLFFVVGISAFFVHNIYLFFTLLTVSLFFGMSSTSPNSTIFLSVVDKRICNFSIGFQVRNLKH